MVVKLTGILAKTDSFERLRLCLVEALEGERWEDRSWERLQRAVPVTSPAYSVPYTLPYGGKADDAGFRGECWVTIPRKKKGAVLPYAAGLLGKEVEIEVEPKRYTFVSGSRHNCDDTVAGTCLMLVTLTETAGPHKI